MEIERGKVRTREEKSWLVSRMVRQSPLVVRPALIMPWDLLDMLEESGV